MGRVGARHLHPEVHSSKYTGYYGRVFAFYVRQMPRPYKHGRKSPQVCLPPTTIYIWILRKRRQVLLAPGNRAFDDNAMESFRILAARYFACRAHALGQILDRIRAIDVLTRVQRRA